MMRKAEVLARMARDERDMMNRLAWFAGEPAALSIVDVFGQVYDRARTEAALAAIRACMAEVREG